MHARTYFTYATRITDAAEPAALRAILVDLLGEVRRYPGDEDIIALMNHAKQKRQALLFEDGYHAPLPEMLDR